MIKNLKWFFLGSVFFACASKGLDIAVFRGNHEKQRIQRQVQVDGKQMLEVILASDPVFSEFQCVHKYDLQQLQKYYNTCKQAGVEIP
jgi:hypothetical protein